MTLPLPPLCALLLDDDTFISELIGQMLSDVGMREIYLESSPLHALATMKEHHPDLLICDLAIPEMDGIEFLKNIAKQGYRGGIIVISGMGCAVLKAAHSLALSKGLLVLGAFEKPLTMIDLQLALEKMPQPQ